MVILYLGRPLPRLALFWRLEIDLPHRQLRAYHDCCNHFWIHRLHLHLCARSHYRNRTSNDRTSDLRLLHGRSIEPSDWEVARLEDVRRSPNSVVYSLLYHACRNVTTVRNVRLCHSSNGACLVGSLSLCQCLCKGRRMHRADMVISLLVTVANRRDMATEKFGFMLIFWNMAGVPFTYGHSTLYLANHPPSEYRWPIYYNIAVYVLLLAAYYIWDTTNSQKNRFRQEMNGALIERRTFPQLPWQRVKNPQVLYTKAGPLLADGWCMDPTFFSLPEAHE